MVSFFWGGGRSPSSLSFCPSHSSHLSSLLSKIYCTSKSTEEIIPTKRLIIFFSLLLPPEPALSCNARSTCQLNRNVWLRGRVCLPLTLENSLRADLYNYLTLKVQLEVLPEDEEEDTGPDYPYWYIGVPLFAAGGILFVVAYKWSAASQARERYDRQRRNQQERTPDNTPQHCDMFSTKVCGSYSMYLYIEGDRERDRDREKEKE